MEFNLCVTRNILGNKLLIAKKVLGNTILLLSISLVWDFFSQ